MRRDWMDFNLLKKREMSSKQQSPRKFKLKNRVAATLLALFAHAGVVNAAGLGRLNVLSQLGQPFAAEIDLINVAKDELATLNVSLAPPAAYQAANLTFDPALNALRLSVERRANGAPYIRATSARRVTEPYLDLLVELTSKDGKLQRRYAALLDLPEVVKPAAVAPAPVTAAPAPKAEVMPPRAPGSSRARKQSAAPDSTPAVVTAPVVPAPASVIPATRTPVTPAAAGNNAVAQLESRAVEPAKSEPLKPAPSIPEPAAAGALTAELPKPEPKEAGSVPAAEPRVAQAPALEKEIVPPPPLLPPQRSVVNTGMNYIVLLGGVALALLAGLGGMWALRRRKQAAVGASEPTLAPTVDAETFEGGATAGAAIAPSAVPASASAAFATAPNEVSAPEATVANVTAIVDPIDEAKVYLEYGQDEQAEKVLRKALSKQPGREDIQMLLLINLSRRGDKDGFNQLAGRLHKQTGGLGRNWKRAMAMGYALDPSYPLYSPADEVAARRTDSPAPANVDIDLGSPAPATDPMSDASDIHLDGGGASTDMEETLVGAHAGVEAVAAAPEPLPNIDFELPPTVTPLSDDIPEKTAAARVATDDPGFNFKIDFPNLKPKLEHERDSTTAAATAANDPRREEIQQKIVLARAYQEMGDKEGALELLRDVEREGDAGQQAEARKMLQTLE